MMNAPNTPPDQGIRRPSMPARPSPAKRPRLVPNANVPQAAGTAANNVQNYFSLRAAALFAVLPYGGPPVPLNAAPPGPAGAGGSGPA